MLIALTAKDLISAFKSLKSNNVLSLRDGRFAAFVENIPEGMCLHQASNPFPERDDITYLGCDSRFHYFSPK